MNNAIAAATLAALLLFATNAGAQAYPSKPIRLVTGAVGGANDLVARVLAQGLTRSLGQPLVVDNRASGNIPAQIVANAPPDGYTLLVQASTFWIGSLIQRTPYDPIRDFAPISFLVKAPNVLVVHPSVPAKTVRELIELAKARPGELNYASGPLASSPHIAGELFKSMAGVNIVRIAYNGTGPALNALLGAHVQLSFPAASAAMPHAVAGRLRALAVTSLEPSRLAAGVPTLAESGLPGFESSSTQGAFAPARTPPAVVARLNQEIVRFLNLPDVQAKLLSAGMETAPGTPEALTSLVKSEMARIGKLVREAGLAAQP